MGVVSGGLSDGALLSDGTRTLSNEGNLPSGVEMEMETIPITEPALRKARKPLDNNIYSTKKTVAQGMMDLALLTANASQLKMLLKYNIQRTSLFFIQISCISISIALQIIVGVLLIINSRYNINRPSHHSRADLMNNLTVIGIFLITVVNVISSSFSDAS
ncbi:ninjurin-A-like [Uloborus diversus]|uniref:ninjurin-A-like n=1 Tax=Uloborus diversus TaxID=327109 RepID=UPI00240A7A37|nr:ninjurin-A-like [Uloborus diversus]